MSLKRTLQQRAGEIFEVFKLAWPMMISMLSMTMMGITDAIFVGFLGTTQLAAVGLATIYFNLLNALCLGTLGGVKVLVAQATGGSDRAQAHAMIWAGCYVSLPMGLGTWAAALWAPEVLTFMGASSPVEGFASEYLLWRALGATPWYIFSALKNGAEGSGDVRSPMRVSLIANGVNVLLDLVLIFGLGPIPALGLKGAAWATTISCALSALMMVYISWSSGLGHARLGLSAISSMLAIGFPMGCRWALDKLGLLILSSMVIRFGEEALAVHHLVLQLISVSFRPGQGVAEATCVLVGQQVGAGRLAATTGTLRSALILGVSMMGGMGALFWCFPAVWLRLFQADPDVLVLGAQILQIAALFQCFDAVAIITAGALHGVGDTRYTMVTSMMTVWLVRLPVGYCLGVTMGLGLRGIWWGWTLQLLLYGVALLWRFIAGRWRQALR